MAAFHFTAKIHSRAKGASAVRAAAYRAAERLYDDRLGKAEDYTRKQDVIETAILAPDGAPAWVHDREALWNRAEARERRRDSQVAQELEINLPRELSDEENWRLITDFAREHLVAHGRVCDIAMHVHEAGDGGLHPHAHILMPLRSLARDALAEKHPDCDWRTFLDRRNRLGELRETWCHFARERAGELGIDLGADWDHRSFETRGIDLEPGPKRGATAGRMDGTKGVEGSPAERTAEFLATQRRNGEALLQNPQIALDALTQQHSTFSGHDLARYIFQHSATDQFQAIIAAARPLAVCVGRDEDSRERFSSESMIAIEAKMVADARAMAGQQRHAVKGAEARLHDTSLSQEQRAAAVELLEAGDLACLIGHAGAGKSTMLQGVREELERAGYTVRGCAPSGIAAESLRLGSGIADARTIASLDYAWQRDREPLTAKDVLIVDEAGMVGSRGLARLIARHRTQARRSYWSAIPSSCRRSRPAPRFAPLPSGSARPS